MTFSLAMSYFPIKGFVMCNQDPNYPPGVSDRDLEPEPERCDICGEILTGGYHDCPDDEGSYER